MYFVKESSSSGVQVAPFQEFLTTFAFKKKNIVKIRLVVHAVVMVSTKEFLKLNI